jgi:pSer/pThr/pTyr-binding forkhead associated (FHA) protein
LRRGNPVVGRIEEVDVVLKAPLVSREHACTLVGSDGAGVSAKDNRRRAGTSVKDSPRLTDQPHSIAPGAISTAGATVATIEYEGPQ